MKLSQRKALFELASDESAKKQDLFLKEKTSLYVFFSFDLVNSTIYKNRQKKMWPTVFYYFYQIIKEEIRREFNEIQVWKYIGDEILFFRDLKSSADLFQIVPGAFRALKSTLGYLDKLFKTEDLKPLSLKGTLWIAPVIEVKGEDFADFKPKWDESANIALNVTYENESSFKDFLGPDIDIGFRIAHYSWKEKLVVSADLAFLLLKSNTPGTDDNQSVANDLRIVSYEDLKGIWDSRYYPVIWYYDDWKKINDSFEYDDRFKEKIIGHIIGNIIKGQTEKMDKLEHIFKQLHILENKNELVERLKEIEKTQKAEEKITEISVLEP
jgi:hypothetical protein